MSRRWLWSVLSPNFPWGLRATVDHCTSPKLFCTSPTISIKIRPCKRSVTQAVLKHDSLTCWRLKSSVSRQQSYIKTICESWPFSNLSGGKWWLKRKYVCRQYETLDCKILHKWWRTCMCDNWMVSFCNIFGQGWVFIFYWYLRLGKNIFHFAMVGRAKFLPRKTFLFGATPTINNDWSLIK
jgi:hypothetical protein